MAVLSRFLEPTLVEMLDVLNISARRVVEGSTVGQHRSPAKGSSVEFRQHRVYVPGDDPRRLDWRVLGRTNRPYVKEFDEETNLRCAILVDHSGSMSYGSAGVTKFEHAAKLTTALAYLMLRQTESVGVGLFSHRLDKYLPPGSSTTQLTRITDLLDRASPTGTSNLADAVHQLANRLERRSLVIVISDLMAPAKLLRDGLAHLHHDRHETIVLRVLDRSELTFPFQQWCRFRGLEGETPLLMEPALARQTYLDNFAAHREQLTQSCAALRAEFETMMTDEPLVDSLPRFLRRRAVR